MTFAGVGERYSGPISELPAIVSHTHLHIPALQAYNIPQELQYLKRGAEELELVAGAQRLILLYIYRHPRPALQGTGERLRELQRSLRCNARQLHGQGKGGVILYPRNRRKKARIERKKHRQ